MAEHESFTEQTKAQAGPAIEEMRGHAEETVHGAARASGTYIYNQKRLAAVEVDGYACALREAARQLHDQQQDSVANYAERAAHSLDSLAHNLRDKDVGDIIDRVSDFARRQPGVFIGGAMALGFMLTRFMKSSASGESTGVMESARSTMKETMETAKEKVSSATESAKEEVASAKEEMKGAASGKEGIREEPTERPYTAADVEIPVILKPQQPEERPPS